MDLHFELTRKLGASCLSLAEERRGGSSRRCGRLSTTVDGFDCRGICAYLN